MKRQHTCAAALMLGCVFATPSNARPDPQATIGPVTQFCGDRVCPNYLSTTPRVSSVAQYTVVLLLRDRYCQRLVLSTLAAIRVMVS